MSIASWSRSRVGRTVWVLLGLLAAPVVAEAHGAAIPAPPPMPPSTDGPRVGPRTPGNPGSRHRAPGPTTGATDGWVGWWDANVDAIRAAAGPMGPTTTNLLDREQLRERMRTTEVVPFLREVLAGKHGKDSDLRATAAIAIGKTTDDPTDVEPILKMLGDVNGSAIERESAALALGTLRRTTTTARFDGRFLDRVRGRLFEAVDDERMRTRTRCFAAFAIGLLGDQPGDEGDPLATNLRNTALALWTRLSDARCDREISVALMVALSLQPPAGAPPLVLENLRALAATGRIRGDDRGDILQAHATVALARLAGPQATGVLLGLSKGKGYASHVRRSALLSLGTLAPRLEPAMRAAALEEVVTHTRRGEPDTTGYAMLSGGRLVAATWAEGPDRTERAALAFEALLEGLAKGNSPTRPFAAIALGLALRDSPTTMDRPIEWRMRDRATKALAAIVDDDGEDPDSRGACALALGLARDDGSLPRFAKIAGHDGLDVALRARAVAAVGLLSRGTPEVLVLLRGSLRKGGPDLVRREAARALGLAGDATSALGLVEELKLAEADNKRSRAAVALAQLGQVAAVRPLIELASDTNGTDAVRAIALAALGVVVDPERAQSLSRLAADANILARTDALNEVTSIF